MSRSPPPRSTRACGFSTEQPFDHWTPVHVHLAAADVTGRGAILDASAWNIHESGNAAPRWKIPIPKLAQCGLAGQLTINAVNKELIVPNGARNVVMTFSWPEVFDEAAPDVAR